MILPNTSYKNSLNSFSIIGINYRKSDMSIRGKFSLTDDGVSVLLKQSISKNISGCLALSTCNRTELYGICDDPNELTELLCSNTNSTLEEFEAYGYVYQGIKAIEHLFKVASGLDSQILGDYEILSQLKHAAKIAKENGCINSFLERAINYSLQVSKEIKTKTKLSSGIVSVAYAAIEILKEKIQDCNGKKILLIGTGKFGNHIAKNLQDYLPGSNMAFANRTEEKAAAMADEYHGEFVSYKSLQQASDLADIIIVSSGGDSYTIFPSFFTTNKPRLILDLSVPQHVDPEVKKIKDITVLNVDEVSLILDQTIAARHSEIPTALKIIEDTLGSLEKWHRQQYNNPVLHLAKSQLKELNKIYFNNTVNEERIHKTVSTLAIQLKVKNNKGCLCINALNSFLQLNHETIS
ncbi:MAG: glutamyl-tRNA reductase [Ginsengibacter sp.]